MKQRRAATYVTHRPFTMGLNEMVTGAGVMVVRARTACGGVAVALCTLGLGAACLGQLSGCSSALAGSEDMTLSDATAVARSTIEGDGAIFASFASDDAAVGGADSVRADGIAASGASESAGAWNDGTYYATGKGGKFGGVPVTVVIKGGRITSITLGANSETGAMAEKARSVVVPQIIDTQGVEDIDAATGATMTSDAIVDGVAQALKRAAA